ncbi:inactive serine protease scarface [Sitodiplosis mosellana]|uniref:inactive serine protease scarface n=1 Tax=Sitodiplosis mosellana TaxID=263140 RepID=UPI002443DF7C|nr:inactive serine protease scarface [Sitodiplosis mosellana]
MYVCFALVGLFFVGAHCGEKDQFDAVVLNSNLFGEQPAEQDGKFWWMSKGSPFKRAVAAGPPQQQFDFTANPFLRSNTAAKLYSAPGYLPPQEPQRPQTTPCQGNGRTCVPKYQCQGGFVDASQVSGSGSQQCNIDTETCCAIRVPTPAPTQPPTRASYIPPPTPARQLPTPCYDRNQVCVPANQCYNGQVQRNSPYASRQPASQCLAPEVCCRVPEEPRPNPSVTVVSYQTSPTTPRPVITKRPVNNQYLPPRDNEVPQPSNPTGAYLPPLQHEEDKSPEIPDNTNNNPSVVRPPQVRPPQVRPPQVGPPQVRPPQVQQDLAPQLPPTACPAATNCTDIQFCAADGTLQSSPVSLTKEQETYRVPLSPCRDESKGIQQGVCCRDLNYTDPWPTNLLRTGAFDANVLAQAFDDGQYRPTNGNGLNKKRGEALKSPINPINPFTASSQQTKQYTNAPFITNAITYNNQPIKTSVSQQPTSPNPFNFQPKQQTFNPPSQFNTPQQNQPQQPPQFVPLNQQAFSSPPLAQASTIQETIATTVDFPTPSPVSQQFQTQQPQTFQPQTFQPQGFQPQQQPPQPKTPASPFRANQLGVCAVRDQTGLPRGNGPNEAAFGEFPWQAMILRESTKTILCGGAIIEPTLVATAAHCVEGLRTHDVLIKGGEWKLGSTEEPKPFQTVRVKAITMHPAYQPTNLESDVALLHLENPLKYDQHIGQICLDESELEPTGSDEECVTSGWGKEQIKYHIAGSLPHSLAINPLSADECESSLGSFNPNSAVCGRAQGNPCDVDNGSALACTRGNGRYLLKGILSTESGCGPNQVMKFTKMDVDFIKGGSAQKSLPLNSNRSGALTSPSPSTTRGLKKYLPPHPQ